MEISTVTPLDNVEWVAVAFIWILFGIGAANIAKSKGENGGEWFVIGFLLGPFGLLFALFSGGKKCPYCKSSIHKDATKCPKCQSDLAEQFPKPDNLLSLPADAHESSSKMKVALFWVVLAIAIVAILIMNLKG